MNDVPLAGFDFLVIGHLAVQLLHYNVIADNVFTNLVNKV